MDLDLELARKDGRRINVLAERSRKLLGPGSLALGNRGTRFPDARNEDRERQHREMAVFLQAKLGVLKSAILPRRRAFNAVNLLRKKLGREVKGRVQCNRGRQAPWRIRMKFDRAKTPYMHAGYAIVSINPIVLRSRSFMQHSSFLLPTTCSASKTAFEARPLDLLRLALAPFVVFPLL